MINLNDKKYQPNRLTKEELLSKYSEYDIFKHYIGDFDLGETYNSPLRRDDRIPSFNIFHSKRHSCLLFKDFAGKRGDCIKFVQYLFYLSSYQEAIEQIDKDMSTQQLIPKSKEDIILPLTKVTYEIRIVARGWTNVDLLWWQQFGISKSTLSKYHVVPIIGYYLNETYIETKGLAFAYAEYKDKKVTFKIYRPNASKSKKWRNNNPYGVHQGYTQLPYTGDAFIITKSLKDVMAIYENSNISAIGVQSETCYIKESVMDEYKFRFDRLFTLFDNDRQGREIAESYKKLYDIPSIFIPDEYGIKDFSDLVKKIGRHEASLTLNNLVK